MLTAAEHNRSLATRVPNGAGEKDVAVPFEEVKATKKDSKVHLVINVTKHGLNNAPGFKYDSDATTWVPDNKQEGKK